jgi:uncharacterized protein (DUF58 family)
MATATPKASDLSSGQGTQLAHLEHEARSVADRLPDILVEAKRVSQTVAHGIHGRRRAGPGETFWQFRHLMPTDSAQLIDWRRSASSDQLYVREREWEAAHTLWLWSDLSASMSFRSHLSKNTKRDRALLLMLAAADLLVRSGERVGLLGLTRPFASRRAATRLAETLALSADSEALTAGLPPSVAVGRFSSVLLFSDFLDPPEKLFERLTSLAASGATGHLVQILDPAEETLPYQGRAEFLANETGERWIGDRVESLRDEYRNKMQSHRAEVAAFASKLGWTTTVHHTDRPATELLLQLGVHLEGRYGQLGQPNAISTQSHAYESGGQQKTPSPASSTSEDPS